MGIESEVQKLEPSALVEFYELDATIVNGGIVRFHANREGQMTWQGLVYDAWPIRAEGFTITSEQQPTPKLMVGNVDGSISVLCLQYDDLIGCKVTRRRTLAKFLDAVNFPEGNPDANPEEALPDDVFYVERRSAETREAVEFELSTAYDFQGKQLPRRPIIQNQCPFVYRGAGCAYTGPAVADALGNPTSDMALDRCGKRLQDCELRQWPDGILNFGGYPAAGLVRT